MNKYKYVTGKEATTYEDILDSIDGFILKEEYRMYAVDQSMILRKTEKSSMKVLNDYLSQGGTVYARIKQYRQPVFNEELDDEIESILYDFATDWERTDYGDEQILEKCLRELKRLLYVNIKE